MRMARRDLISLERPEKMGNVHSQYMSKSETTLCVARLEGGEHENLPRSEVKRRLRSGAMRQSQYIWHPGQQSWKQAREFAELLRTTGPVAVPDSPQPVAPTPPAAVVARPKAVVKTPSTAKAVSQRVAAAPRTAAAGQPAPQTHATPSPNATPGAAAQASGQKLVDELYGNQRRKQILYGIACAVIVAAIALLNVVEMWRVKSAVANSPLKGTATVSAHYGFFVQPWTLIVQIKDLPPNMPHDQFVELLTSLAVKTRGRPLIGGTYQFVKLQSGWTTKYVMRGEAWEALADSKGEEWNQRARLLIDNIYLPDGHLVLGNESAELAEMYKFKTEKFHEVCRTFIP